MYDKSALCQLIIRLSLVPSHVTADTILNSNDWPIRAAAKLSGKSEAEIASAVAKSLKVDFLDLESETNRKRFKTSSYEESIDTAYCWEHRIAPLYSENGTLIVAQADPLDMESQRFLGTMLSVSVKAVVAEEIKLVRLLGEHYPPPKNHLDSLLDVGGETLELVNAKDNSDAKIESSPVVKLVNQIFLDAVQEGASDIHVEPLQFSLEVRYRIDGVMQSRLEIPKRLQSHVISRIKLLAGMDIAERRKPQDGRLRIRIKGEEIDLRASAVPVSHGENLVLRILRSNAKQLTFVGLGIDEQLQSRLNRLIRSQGKMVVVTGPTGSGKTTTLYACLNQLCDGRKTIMTVENPVEYRVAGIQQIQVNEVSGVTFSSALRSILRQDPDVIMVGEIRDSETADIAVQAAETGHVVLSTLHTNDAPSAVTRFLSLGVQKQPLANALAAVLAQRLVRRVCKECATPPVECQDSEIVKVCKELRIPTLLHNKGAGCPACHYLGFKGRLSLFSFFEVSEDIRGLIERGASIQEIEELASKEGYKPIEQVALEYAASGETAVEEIRDYVSCRPVTQPTKKIETEVAATPSQTVPRAPKTPGSRPKLLIVEDSDEIRMTIAALLARERFEVIEALNGEVGIDKVFSERPELIICDLKMPVMDGQEFLARVKGDPETRHIPVIMLTASDDEANEVMLLNLGARDFISKTSTPKVIATRVRRALQENQE